MNNFLNVFSKSKRNSKPHFLSECRTIFTNMIDVAWRSLGKDAFRPSGIVNAAVFDSVGVGIATRLQAGVLHDFVTVKKNYNDLLQDPDYRNAIESVTSSETSVETRMTKAIDTFKHIA